MKCTICRNGMTETGYATVLLEKDSTTLVFKNVPAQICANCGEEYISSEINKAILSRAREELRSKCSVLQLRFHGKILERGFSVRAGREKQSTGVVLGSGDLHQ